MGPFLGVEDDRFGEGLGDGDLGPIRDEDKQNAADEGKGEKDQAVKPESAKGGLRANLCHG